MTGVTIILLAVSLSVDVTAVSVTLGICKGQISWREIFVTSAYFGMFHILMPTIGYYTGSFLAGVISPFDHVIAFLLLAFVGGRMIYDALVDKPLTEDSCPKNNPLSYKNLSFIALATSIDALAAGISLALDGLPLLASVLTIGLVTFIFSSSAMRLGKKLGLILQRRATLVGGSVLILIGLRILLENISL